MTDKFVWNKAEERVEKIDDYAKTTVNIPVALLTAYRRLHEWASKTTPHLPKAFVEDYVSIHLDIVSSDAYLPVVEGASDDA